MALDFYNNLDRSEHLSAVKSDQFAALSEIFTEFRHQTGIIIDEYGDSIIDVNNQKTLLKIINSYIQKNDLNSNKKETVLVIEFRSMLKYFSERNISFQALGD